VAIDPTGETNTSPQTYQLSIEVAAPISVCIGRLGTFIFQAGIYIYTGSARKNMDARLKRHFSRAKKMHWHIDYLLAAPGVRVLNVVRLQESECEVNQRTIGELPVKGFGASDCISGCGSHLKRLR
jgi:Uri superfamily endonuclease